ncbi:MAG: proteasome subunit beta [Actinomycetota bacterium]
MTGPLFPEPGTPGLIGANPSFSDLLRGARAEALPATEGMRAEGLTAHGTTVLGLKFEGGVIVAGDRRATAGYEIADDRMQKVFEADTYSAIAISGAAGQAVEIVKLFQVELEHYEKVTGDRLSLEGKANRLAQMIRENFPLALQGLIVVPLFGGFDERRDEGRLFRYDATGGRWEDEEFHATGSGGRGAKGTLKKEWRPGLSRDEAIRLAVDALLDAAEEDVATGGPSLSRGIFPTVRVITAGGVEEVAEDELRAAVEAVEGERR